jgi:hypothetical protein
MPERGNAQGIEDPKISECVSENRTSTCVGRKERSRWRGLREISGTTSRRYRFGVTDAGCHGFAGGGVAGMLEMKQSGAYTIAQDEASCVVFGMPKEAIKMGGVASTVPLVKVAAEILSNV